jgi:Flp pilus assembly protein TadD
MRREAPIALALVLVLLGCRPAGDQRTETLSAEDGRAARSALSPEVAARIDSGNAAYRERRDEAALRHFREAARLDSTLAAAWFGVYMAEQRRGNTDAAEAALQRARRAEPGASLIEPPAAGNRWR